MPGIMGYVEEVGSGGDIVAIISKATEDAEVYHFGELLELAQTQQATSSQRVYAFRARNWALSCLCVHSSLEVRTRHLSSY